MVISFSFGRCVQLWICILKRRRFCAIKDVVTFWPFLYTTYFTVDAKAPLLSRFIPQQIHHSTSRNARFFPHHKDNKFTLFCNHHTCRGGYSLCANTCHLGPFLLFYTSEMSESCHGFRSYFLKPGSNSHYEWMSKIIYFININYRLPHPGNGRPPTYHPTFPTPTGHPTFHTLQRLGLSISANGLEPWNSWLPHMCLSH
jgi:hypothetical protein